MPDLLEYKCPCCGGAISFDAVSQQLKCPSCGNSFEVETLQSYDEIIKEENVSTENMRWQTENLNEWDSDEAKELNSYICNSCGAQILTDKNTAASICPFCLTPIAITEQLSGGLKPDIIIPFQITKKDAQAALLEHYKGKKLLPKVFSEQNKLDEIKGIYVPFWLFSSDANADIRYNATRMRTWKDKRYEYTETSYYAVLRSGKLSFENVPVDGDTKLPDDMMEAIEPFDFSKAVNFSTAYLASYLADRYDVDENESIERANHRVKSSVEASLAATVTGYATVDQISSKVNIASGKITYGLLPVWLLTTSWNGNKYLFAMNGQTGKFIGDLPIDKKLYFQKYLTRAFLIGSGLYAAMWALALLK